MAEPKLIGEVTHFYDKAGVAVVKFSKNISCGAKVKFLGASTDFDAVLDSMQLDHSPVAIAKKGKEVGVKVGKKVREGDKVYQM